MFDRMSTPLDLPSIPIPDSGLVGFAGYRDCVECWPVYAVTQADWDELKDYWPRRRFMTTLDVIKRELLELQKKADAIVKDERSFTQELRALAFDLSGKIGSAVESCELPSKQKAPF